MFIFVMSFSVNIVFGTIKANALRPHFCQDLGDCFHE